MLKYFQEGLKPSILVELKYQNLELESFDQMLKKAVNTKAKSAFWSCSNIKEIDQNCPQGNQSANSIFVKNQSNAIKNFWVEKPNVQSIKSLSSPQHS